MALTWEGNTLSQDSTGSLVVFGEGSLATSILLQKEF